MVRPTLDASFQPQQWIDDNAVDSAPRIDFDATEAVLSLDASEFRRLSAAIRRDYGRDLDIVAERAGLVGNGEGQHNGPFTVDIDPEDFTDFLNALGIDDGETITDSALTAARDRTETVIGVAVPAP